MEVEIKHPSSSMVQRLPNWMSGRPNEVESSPIIADTESTFGVDIVSSLDLSSLPSTLDESKGIDYVAWDFAGQLEYTSLHPVSNSFKSIGAQFLPDLTFFSQILFFLVLPLSIAFCVSIGGRYLKGRYSRDREKYRLLVGLSSTI